MNLQEIFNTAYLGLKSQGFVQSMNVRGCAYRGDEGRRCAIGWCIPDNLYNDRLEGVGVSIDVYRICDMMGLDADQLLSTEIEALSTLQNCHDLGDTPEVMLDYLSKFARDHNLTIPEN